jgi:hypothetical protein
MVPQTARFNNLLEGLTEFTKGSVLLIMVYYKERMQIKISQGMTYIESSGKVPNAELPMSSLYGVMGSISFLASTCGNTY